MATNPIPPDLTFEAAYNELQTIVTRLESGSLPLDESLQLFERGQALTAWCNQQLDSAELRVSQLSSDGQSTDL